MDKSVKKTGLEGFEPPAFGLEGVHFDKESLGRLVFSLSSVESDFIPPYAQESMLRLSPQDLWALIAVFSGYAIYLLPFSSCPMTACLSSHGRNYKVRTHVVSSVTEDRITIEFMGVKDMVDKKDVQNSADVKNTTTRKYHRDFEKASNLLGNTFTADFEKKFAIMFPDYSLNDFYDDYFDDLIHQEGTDPDLFEYISRESYLGYLDDCLENALRRKAVLEGTLSTSFDAIVAELIQKYPTWSMDEINSNARFEQEDRLWILNNSTIDDADVKEKVREDVIRARERDHSVYDIFIKYKERYLRYSKKLRGESVIKEYIHQFNTRFRDVYTPDDYVEYDAIHNLKLTKHSKDALGTLLTFLETIGKFELNLHPIGEWRFAMSSMDYRKGSKGKASAHTIEDMKELLESQFVSPWYKPVFYCLLVSGARPEHFARFLMETNPRIRENCIIIINQDNINNRKIAGLDRRTLIENEFICIDAEPYAEKPKREFFWYLPASCREFLVNFIPSKYGIGTAKRLSRALAEDLDIFNKIMEQIGQSRINPSHCRDWFSQCLCEWGVSDDDASLLTGKQAANKVLVEHYQDLQKRLVPIYADVVGNFVAELGECPPYVPPEVKAEMLAARDSDGYKRAEELKELSKRLSEEYGREIVIETRHQSGKKSKEERLKDKRRAQTARAREARAAKRRLNSKS